MKAVKILVTLLILLLIGGVIAWQMAPKLIGSALSKKLQVEVTINDIALSSDAVTVKKVDIANPSGSVLPKAFTVDTIKVDAPLNNYTKDSIVIDEISLNNVYISLEFATAKAMAGNWAKIVQNMEKTSSEEPKEDSKKEQKKQTSVLIKKLILTDVNVDIVNGLLGTSVQKLQPIKRIEFDNISSDSGIPMDQIIMLILKETLKQGNASNLLEKLIPSPSGLLEKVILPFKL